MPLLAVRSSTHVHTAANKAVPASYPLTRRHLFGLFIFYSYLRQKERNLLCATMVRPLSLAWEG